MDYIDITIGISGRTYAAPESLTLSIDIHLPSSPISTKPSISHDVAPYKWCRQPRSWIYIGSMILSDYCTYYTCVYFEEKWTLVFITRLHESCTTQSRTSPLPKLSKEYAFPHSQHLSAHFWVLEMIASLRLLRLGARVPEVLQYHRFASWFVNIAKCTCDWA